MSADDRLLAAFRALVRAEDARRAYGATWEYVVVSSTRENGVVVFEGRPTATADEVDPIELPDAIGWELRSGIPGGDWVLAPDSLVYVTFANRDPSRPVVVGYRAAPVPDSTSIDSTGTMAIGASADRIELAAGDDTIDAATAVAEKRLVRWGDPILFGVPGAGTVLPPPGPLPASKVSG